MVDAGKRRQEKEVPTPMSTASGSITRIQVDSVRRSFFSHGLLLDSTIFASQVAAFRDSYRCIAWDERGHGKSATDTEPGYSCNDSASDLSGLLSFLDIDSAILVGVAKGAFLGMTCGLPLSRAATMQSSGGLRENDGP
jgi:hypothetical protein